jgi:hypothetical protein
VQQETPVTTFAAKIMAAAEKLALGANESRTGETAPANGNIRVIFAKSSCHNRIAIFVIQNRDMSF